MLPVVAVIRISRDTDDSSALQRQEVRLAEAAADRNYKIVGWVKDITVSGAVSLDKRPSLGKWLREPLVHLWKGLLVVSQDRITRDDLHWWAFVHWCLQHDKQIIILDDPTFDITTPTGRMIAAIKAGQAAAYREAVRQKRMDQMAWHRKENLWAGGRWPYGYRAVRVMHQGRPRWRLEIDPHTSAMVREAYDRLVNKGHSMLQIVEDWNARGILTSRDYQRQQQALAGREHVSTQVRGTPWSVTSLRVMLTRPTLMGYDTYKGEIRRSPDGLPIQVADPVLTPAEFEQLQRVLEQRGVHQRGRPNTKSPFRGIFWCMCGSMLYQATTKQRLVRSVRVYIYFRCAKGRQCPNYHSWSKNLLVDALGEMVLAVAGDLEVTEKTFVPGVDYSSEIAELESAIENLTGSLAKMTPGSAGAEAVMRAIEQHSAALEKLRSLPATPSRWEERGTGERFREFWARHEWPERSELLRKLGIRLYVAGSPKAPDFDLFLPDDLQERVTDALYGKLEPGFTDVMNKLADQAMAERRAIEKELRRR